MLYKSTGKVEEGNFNLKRKSNVLRQSSIHIPKKNTLKKITTNHNTKTESPTNSNSKNQQKNKQTTQVKQHI